jgi:N-acetylglucosaminyl-diphospho-decaprenol L-rhamnosyltransferase
VIQATTPRSAPTTGREAELAVIILNFRTPQLVGDCLDSLRDQVGAGIIVLIVDNASNDGSAEKIRAFIAERGYTFARVVESPVNGGFAAGNNVGIRAIDADAYLLLNSDTLVRPGALLALRDALSRYPNAGLIVPRTENVEGQFDRNAFVTPRPLSEFVRGAKIGMLSRLLRRFDVVADVPKTSFEPEWVGFCAVVVRREVIERAGLLDEQFFMYYEDIDYCLRVRRAGFTIVYFPEARVVHLLGGSSGLTSKNGVEKRAARYMYEARARFFAKHYGMPGLLAANVAFGAGYALSRARGLATKRSFGHREREPLDVWINAFAPFRPYTHPGGRN